MTPTGATADFGQLGLSGLEGRGLKIVLAKQPTVVAGHGFTTGQIPPAHRLREAAGGGTVGGWADPLRLLGDARTLVSRRSR
jgi:hypothetical protein